MREPWSRTELQLLRVELGEPERSDSSPFSATESVPSTTRRSRASRSSGKKDKVGLRRGRFGEGRQRRIRLVFLAQLPDRTKTRGDAAIARALDRTGSLRMFPRWSARRSRVRHVRAARHCFLLGAHAFVKEEIRKSLADEFMWNSLMSFHSLIKVIYGRDECRFAEVTKRKYEIVGCSGCPYLYNIVPSFFSTSS